MARFLAITIALLAVGISAVSAHSVVWCLGRDAFLNDVVAIGSYHSSTESGWNTASVTVASSTDPGFTPLVLSNWILEPTPGAPSDYFGCGFGCTDYCSSYDVTGIRTWQVKVLPQNTFTQGAPYQITQTSTQAVDQPWPGCGSNANVVYPVLPPLGVDSITCPGDLAITMTASCSRTASWPPSSITCTSACPGVVCSSTQTTGGNSGTAFPIGTTTVTYQLILDGLTAPETCSFDVVVTDNTNPSFTSCPGDQIICGPSPQVVTWTAPTATDCTTVMMTESHVPGSSFNAGTTTVTYTATDTSMNVETCSFDITVDNGSATITCPGDITLVQAADCDSFVSWSPVMCTPPCVTQTCSVQQMSGLASGQYPVGLTTNVFELSVDGSSTGTTCQFDVDVSDNTPPTTSNCPADMTLCGPDGTAVTWTPPTFTDCQGTTITSSHNPGDAFNLGTTTVTYTAQDLSGNTQTCNFDVFLYINTASITCPPDQTLTQTAACDATTTWAAPTCTTECDDQTCSAVQTSGDFSGSNFAPGSNAVVYDLLIDGSANGMSCTFSIDVDDVTPPALASGSVCPADQSECGGDGTTFTWTAPVFTDCQTMTLTNSHDSGDGFPVGTTTVTYSAVDASGLTTTCSFDITVFSGPPSITCPADYTVSTAQASAGGPGAGPTTFTTNYSVTAADSCGGSSVTVTQVAGAPGPPATIPFTSLPMTFTYQTAPDSVNGQQASCSFEVSGVFAQVSSVLQGAQYRFGDVATPPPNGRAALGLYVTTTLCWELFNTPATNDVGTLVIHDGNNIVHTFTTMDGAATFSLDAPGSCMDFLGPHQVTLGDYYLGVMGTTTLLANNWPAFELVAIADQFQAPA